MKMKSLLLVALTLIAAMMAARRIDGQERSDNKSGNASVAASGGVSASEPAATELARVALASLGGEKFRNLKSLSLFGAVEVYYASSPQHAATGQFAIVQAGDRARTDIETPEFKYREIYDGKRPYSTVNAASVWVPTKFGLPVLGRFDQTGYTVTAVADQKNQRGFRITDTDGNATDFFVDQGTGRIMQYSFDYHSVKFIFENKAFKEVEGVLVPTSFVRRMVLPRVDVFMEFKVKEAKVNQPVGDEVFIIPEH